MGTRQFTRRELEGHNHREDAIFVIKNVVYDVTKFLENHPGGVEVLLDNAGKDASQCFQDVGHSKDALQYMARYMLGEVAAEDRHEGVLAADIDSAAANRDAFWRVWIPVLVYAVFFYVIFYYL